MAAARETSIRRGIEILLLLGEDESLRGGGLSVTRIAQLVGRDKSQISRTLSALAESGLVEKAPDSRSYRLGWQIHALAHRAGQPRLLEEGQRVLNRLVEDVEESAFVTVRQGDEALTVLAASPERPILASGWVGRSTPLTSTASGRALLVGQTREEFDALVDRVPPVAHTDRTVLGADEIWRQIEVDRARGYSVVDEEYEPELLAIAAPVLSPGGSVIAAVNAAGPRYRFKRNAEAATDCVVAAAAGLAASLGLRSPSAAA